ncbi:MAG: DinB family protein [Bacteroidetes bacterium]|nr:DinB family protein [Bacteroidota bacterium]
MITEAINENLEKAVTLLQTLDKKIYTDTSTPPYHSSIGGHVRHLLDVFDCAIKGLPHKEINLICRNRDIRIETDKQFAIENIQRIQAEIENLKNADLNVILPVTDDHGKGQQTINYTLGAILGQAQSHAIHHYAIIGYILNHLNVEVTDKTFGYNPTTPRQEAQAS